MTNVKIYLTFNEENALLGLCLSYNEDKVYKKVNYTTVLAEFCDCILNTSNNICSSFLYITNKNI